MLRYPDGREFSMLMPAAMSQRDKIWDAVSEIEAALKPDIVRIRYSMAEDWKDQ
jgi:hypothetical protein